MSDKITPLKHGKRSTTAYRMWDGMIQRCYNEKYKYYDNYGGRGITVHKSWRSSFTEFYNFISNLDNYVDNQKEGSHSNKITIDRIDVNGNYEPNNVQILKFKDQVYNRRVSTTNKSGFTGIYYYDRYEAFQVSICVERKQIHLGYFKEINEAVNARNSYIINNNLKHKLQ